MFKTLFSGFPARAEVTPIPNLFFTTVMPQIEDIAELKTVLYIFWLVSRRRGNLQGVTYDELLSDSILMDCFDGEAGSKREALRRVLDRAVQHGIILHLKLDREGKLDDVYLINNEVGRKTVERIQQGKLPRVALAPGEERVSKARLPNIFSLYEQNIGVLTPMIAEELVEAEKLYPPQWIEDAFREAVALNKRSWKYISRILERWAIEGKDDGKPGRDTKKEEGKDKYTRGRYGHIVKR
ncbi:MAG TPA: DnaD domain protein [Dehalococcoidia bacterium]|nr:DnaD domain protein [Dehalococcoidia bacterium]